METVSFARRGGDRYSPVLRLPRDEVEVIATLLSRHRVGTDGLIVKLTLL